MLTTLSRPPLVGSTSNNELHPRSQTDKQQKNRRKAKKITWRRLMRATSSPVADALAARPSISPRLPKASTTMKMRTRTTTSRTLRICSSRVVSPSTSRCRFQRSAKSRPSYLFTIITATLGIGYCTAVQGVSGRRMNTCCAFQHSKGVAARGLRHTRPSSTKRTFMSSNSFKRI